MNILSFNELGAFGDHEDDEAKDGDNCARKHAAFQHGFGLSSSPKLKPKTRRNNSFEVHGGRIVRSTGRTDRHSKIATARGTKDRRVRLSPKTAILFYDVQDRLGYDRPSKAIDWLMKEAKAAIDALDEPPPPPTTNAAQIHGSVSQQMLNTDYPISSFGFFTEAAATATATSYDEFNSSISTSTGEQFSSAPLATSPEIFDANLEMARLQRIFSWNYSPPLQFPAVADSGHGYGHMFSDREPLQSSYSRFFHNSPQFAGVNFSDEEMLNFATSATFKEDDKDDIIIPVSNNS